MKFLKLIIAFLFFEFSLQKLFILKARTHQIIEFFQVQIRFSIANVESLIDEGDKFIKKGDLENAIESFKKAAYPKSWQFFI